MFISVLLGGRALAYRLLYFTLTIPVFIVNSCAAIPALIRFS